MHGPDVEHTVVQAGVKRERHELRAALTGREHPQVHGPHRVRADRPGVGDAQDGVRGGAGDQRDQARRAGPARAGRFSRSPGN
jgi:hypothetical protein